MIVARSRRLLGWALLGLWLLVMPALADTAPQPIATADLEKLVAQLQDPTQRDHLVKDLQALIAAQRAHPAPSVNPSDIISRIGDHVQDIGAELVEAAADVVDVPRLADWVEAQAGDPAARQRWVEIARNVGLILGSAVLCDLVLRLGLAPVRRRLTGHGTMSLTARLGLLTLRLLLDVLPIIGFAAIAHFVLPLVHPRAPTAGVVRTGVNAILSARLLTLLAHAVLLAPREGGWSLLSLGEESANYLYIWLRRFIVVAVYGFALCTAAWWLSTPGAVEGLLEKLVALALAILAIVFVLQNRVAVAEWLRPHRPTPPPDGAENGAEAIEPEPIVIERLPGFNLLRQRIAEIWHVLAIVYILGIFGVYALRIEGGFSFIFRANLFSLALIALARLLVGGINRLAARGFAIPEELRQRFPTLEARSNRYLPIVSLIASILIWAATLLNLAEIWGLGSYAWFDTDLGRHVTGAMSSTSVILVLAVAVWEVLNASIDRFLAGADENGQVIARSARMRTLLPLLRNAVLVTLLLVVSLLVMSELGINIAPLLAGAGVIGLAIGFGSQALVKDIITGLFMLIEDTIAVGDVVDLGGGHAGVIEGISIRTIKLRDSAGTLHTVPFSGVDKVMNLSKQFAYVVIDLGVTYATDTDRVLDLYRELGAELRADPVFGPDITQDLETIGLTSFGASAVQVQARIKTKPLRQWAVGREFNRRIKQRFDAEGISLAYPTRTLILDDSVLDALARLRPVAPIPDSA